MIKRIASICFVLLAGIVAVVAGQWNNSFPVVGGAAYCATTVNAVCTSTIVAGPTALTGNEVVPADTGLSGGRAPQTVVIPVGRLGAGPTTYNVPASADSITITNTTRRLIVIPAGTIAALTVVFPAASTLTAADGQLFGLCTTQIVSTLTLTAGADTTIANGPTALLVPVATGAGSCVEWIYRLSNTTWYRVQ